MILSYLCLLVLILILFTISEVDSLFIPYFTLDYMGAYLSFITLLFVIFFLSFGGRWISNIEGVLICCSSLASIICFLSDNIVLFWLTYEVAILLLIFCVLVGSPYSERFLAFWYLLGYVGATSLPLLVSVLYVGVSGLSTSFSCNETVNGGMGLILGSFIFVLFATKVPLPPFHSWLPVVHAEASTFVSVCLSGFIMKLGIAGIYRFVLDSSGGIMPGLAVLLWYSVFIIGSCLSELDTKRWLAYLSLGHIIVGVVGLVNNEDIVKEAPLYCLGHGFSAMLLFVVFLFLYELLGSRNWFSVILGGRLGVTAMVVLSGGLLTASSFPSTINFFCEIFILNSSFCNLGVSLAYFVYLFAGGLAPILILSYLLCSASESFGWSNATLGLLMPLLIFCGISYLFVFFV
uniref:NADH dehydrogenase subunit 4 n=1 Tax=Cichlidogyrus halli TaxID=321991 RepID=UPI00315D279C